MSGTTALTFEDLDPEEQYTWKMEENSLAWENYAAILEWNAANPTQQRPLPPKPVRPPLPPRPVPKPLPPLPPFVEQWWA